MSTQSLPLPQRGQPISYGDLSNIVNNINNLNSKISSATSQSGFIGKTGTQYSQKISEMVVFAGYKDVTSGSQTVTAKTSIPFEVAFNVNFKIPPIVTATPQSLNNTATSNSAIAVISQVTTSKVSGVVSFNDTGTQASVGINVIAVGIPN